MEYKQQFNSMMEYIYDILNNNENEDEDTELSIKDICSMMLTHFKDVKAVDIMNIMVKVINDPNSLKQEIYMAETLNYYILNIVIKDETQLKSIRGKLTESWNNFLNIV